MFSPFYFGGRGGGGCGGVEVPGFVGRPMRGHPQRHQYTSGQPFWGWEEEVDDYYARQRAQQRAQQRARIQRQRQEEEEARRFYAMRLLQQRQAEEEARRRALAARAAEMESHHRKPGHGQPAKGREAAAKAEAEATREQYRLRWHRVRYATFVRAARCIQKAWREYHSRIVTQQRESAVKVLVRFFRRINTQRELAPVLTALRKLQDVRESMTRVWDNEMGRAAREEQLDARGAPTKAVLGTQEELTRCLLRCDSVESYGSGAVRDLRRAVVRQIQNYLDTLEVLVANARADRAAGEGSFEAEDAVMEEENEHCHGEKIEADNVKEGEGDGDGMDVDGAAQDAAGVAPQRECRNELVDGTNGAESDAENSSTGGENIAAEEEEDEEEDEDEYFAASDSVPMNTSAKSESDETQGDSLTRHENEKNNIVESPTAVRSFSPLRQYIFVKDGLGRSIPIVFH